jgi:hypothetical protein
MGWGLVLAGLLGGAVGIAISIHGGPYVGGTASDAGNLAPFFWSRDGGDLRVVHFLGIHAMQALPLLGVVLLWARGGGCRRRACGWPSAPWAGWR